MGISDKLKQKIEADLGLNLPFVKGQNKTISNCWHFTTDGNAVDEMFADEEDFVRGMNRIYFVVKDYEIAILAFCLMDTHVHFVLYGEFVQCNEFMHEYVRRTSQYLSWKYGEKSKLKDVPIHFQKIDTDTYLKTAICYVIKNPPVAGVPFTAYDYPWSSGPLLFRKNGYWTLQNEIDSSFETREISSSALKLEMKTHQIKGVKVRVKDDLIFPGEYVEYELVERIFRTHRSFNFFMCVSKESDIESREGEISRLSIPMSEMRGHKAQMCLQMFGCKSVKNLNTSQRLQLARRLKSKYNSSIKQIIRLCGLVYEECKDKV